MTNSLRRITELALDGIGREFFDVTVCGDEVRGGKPAPDPYLRAAELLGVPVAACVAVEDSPNGALAAERAGAAVLVVPCEVPVPAGPRRTFPRRPRRADRGRAGRGAAGGVRTRTMSGWPDGRVRVRRPVTARPCRAVRRGPRHAARAAGHPAHPAARRSQHAHPDRRVTGATTDTVSDNGTR